MQDFLQYLAYKEENKYIVKRNLKYNPDLNRNEQAGKMSVY